MNLPSKNWCILWLVLEALPMDWYHYHPLHTIYHWLELLSASSPRLRLEVVGLSEEGRNLVAVHVGEERQEKPVIFVEGGIHARSLILSKS